MISVRFSMDTNPRRTPTSSNHKPRLKTNAVPSIYADLPSYLSNEANNMNSAIYKLKKRGHTNRRGGSAAKKNTKNAIIIM